MYTYSNTRSAHKRTRLYKATALLLITLLVSSCSRTPLVNKQVSFKGIKTNLISMKNSVVRATPRVFKLNKPRYPAALPLRGYPTKKPARKITRTSTKRKTRYPAALPLRKTSNPRVCPTPNTRVALARGNARKFTTPRRNPVPRIVPVSYTAPTTARRQTTRPQPAQRPQINPQQANQQLFNLAKQANAGQINNLLNQGANVNAANSSGETALHSAASTGNTGAAQALLQRGANVNARTVRGWTPLHTAARFGRGHFVAMLLNRGAQRNIQNIDGKTPMQLARQSNHQSIVAMLQR